MSLSIPLFSFPHVWTNTQNLFRVLYSDATTQTVAATGGTYFPDGSTSGLLSKLQTEFNADATNGGTWVVAFDANFKLSITQSGGSKTVSAVEALQPDLLSFEDLGYDTSGTNSMLISALAAADWRPARLWSPDEWSASDGFTLDADVVMARSRQSGRVVASSRAQEGGIRTYEYITELIQGALIWGYAADDADLYGAVPWMQLGDQNSSLDRFWLKYLSQISSFALPRARYAPDRTAPNTNTAVQLFIEQLAFSDIASKVEDSPLLGNVTIRAVPWVG